MFEWPKHPYQRKFDDSSFESSINTHQRIARIQEAIDCYGLRKETLAQLESLFLASTDPDEQRIILQTLLPSREQFFHPYDSEPALPIEMSDSIDRMAKKEDLSYFFQQELLSIKKPPLTQYPTQEKRKFLEDCWDFFCESGEIFLSLSSSSKQNIPENPSDMEDSLICELFDQARTFNPDLFFHQEFLDFKDRLHSEALEKEFRSIPPSSHRSQENWRWGSDDPLLVTQLSPEFGVAYNAHSEVIAFFSPQAKNRPAQELSLDEILRHEGFSKKNQITEASLKRDYLYLLQPAFRIEIEKELGVSLQTLSVRNQLQFLSFLLQKNETEVCRVFSFVNKANPENKIHRLLSFLSLEQGGKEMGEKILTIADRLDTKTADAIFEKYASVVALAQETENRVREILDETGKSNTQAIAQNLLARAQKTMALFADHPEWDARAIEAKLDSFNAELFLFADTFQAMRNADADFSLETVRDTRILLLEGKQIPSELFEQMQALYEQNYLSAPEPFRQLLQDKLLARRDDPHTRFYIVTHKNRVIGFNTFTDVFDESDPPQVIERYFASFNIDPALANSKIGDALMQASLDKEFETRPIVADCIPEAPITQTYLNKKGFVGTGMQMIKGVPLLQIRKDKTLSERLATTQETLSQNLSPKDLSETNLFSQRYLLTQCIPTPEKNFSCVFKKI